MPMDWPSSTGKGTAPKSRMRWRTSLSASAAVMRRLPVTVAWAGVWMEAVKEAVAKEGPRGAAAREDQ